MIESENDIHIHPSNYHNNLETLLCCFFCHSQPPSNQVFIILDYLLTSCSVQMDKGCAGPNLFGIRFSGLREHKLTNSNDASRCSDNNTSSTTDCVNYFLVSCLILGEQ